MKRTGDWFLVFLVAAYCAILVGEIHAFMLGNRGAYEIVCVLLWGVFFLAIFGVMAAIDKQQRGPKVIEVTPEGRRIVDPMSILASDEATAHLEGLEMSFAHHVAQEARRMVARANKEASTSARERAIIELGYHWPITESSLSKGHDEREIARAVDALARAGLLAKDTEEQHGTGVD